MGERLCYALLVFWYPQQLIYRVLNMARYRDNPKVIVTKLRQSGLRKAQITRWYVTLGVTGKIICLSPTRATHFDLTLRNCVY